MIEAAIGIYIIGFIARLVWIGTTERFDDTWDDDLWQGMFALLWPAYAILFAPAAIIRLARASWLRYRKKELKNQ